MDRSLIIARVIPDAEQQVAEIFAESDRTELPGLAGVRHRSLYRLHDLYVHLIETDDSGTAAVAQARRHPEFDRVSQRLAAYISPYLPTWRAPQDAIAHRFYRWDAPAEPSRRKP
ncbi:TcmI family type II polyketide cyclase [Solwaraspora sp. WMMD406]|uniref:TcmI family type II polyketide cyclase n=1 Tax=Solwaraspora sp. WMMD406 TaxID=3016095 RepID=UPI002417299A|nr:TcmI family type II polyketide cyclase [Solwaraspora sp. WMMD406]MDG4764061.1 TcmI family type II polyketide cyclase [Solwaraspora sp. WMMD406]